MSKIIILARLSTLEAADLQHSIIACAKNFRRWGTIAKYGRFHCNTHPFCFRAKTQFSEEPAPEGININLKINSINPLNWFKTGNQLRKENQM